MLYKATVKVIWHEESEVGTTCVLREQLRLMKSQSIITDWGYVATGSNTRAFPEKVDSYSYFTNDTDDEEERTKLFDAV